MTDDARQGMGSQVRQGVSQGASEPHETAEKRAAERLVPASIRLLYESRDGRFCLYETAGGHLAAVDATKFV